MVGLARDRVGLGGQVGDVPGVDHVGRDEVELDRGVDRDDQLVVGEGAVGVLVAPEPLLAGGFDLQRFGVGDLQPVRAGRRRLARLVGVDDAEDEDRRREDGQRRADPELDPAPAGEPGAARRRARRGSDAGRRAGRRRSRRRRSPRRRGRSKAACRSGRCQESGAPKRGHSNHARGRPAACATVRRRSRACSYTRRPHEQALPPIPGAAKRRARRGGGGDRRRRRRAAAAPAACACPPR